ncbi:MAG: YgeY family selenium metabolism-linked hydrolase [Candidatus Eisenbacteria sp.]|nr:YgeY family selenium metabolism-linked hydrolase [Candidatus Eisenbacteria bacterium]
MKSKLCREIVSRAQAYQEDTALLLGDLIRIPSLSGQEEQVIGRIRTAMTAAGFDEVRIDGLGSVIGRIGEGPVTIAMDAHIDTVDVGDPEAWSVEPHGGRILDGRVWGRGAADQKGGMAALITGGRIIKELDLAKKYTLYVTGTVMEEDCDGLCWHHLIKEEGLKPEVCVLTEPTACRVYRGQRGRMEIEVEVRGRSAHASAPERGRNAIYRMAELVRGLERLSEQLPTDDFLGQGSLAVTYMLGEGPSLCAVPDTARAHIDRRITIGETRDSVLAGMQHLAHQFGWAAEEGACTWRVRRYEKPAYTGKVYPAEAVFPAWKVAGSHPAVKAADEAYELLFADDAPFTRQDDEPNPERWTFSTNGVAICGDHGIPCIGFGPGHEEQAHAPDEFCPIDHLAKAAAFYACFPGLYCEKRGK